MFDIGFSEITIILLIGLLVIGPERLPEVARKVGLAIGKAKRFVQSVRSDIENELRTDELEKMLKEQKQQIQNLKGAFDSKSSDIVEEVKQVGESLKVDAESEGPFSTLTAPKSSPKPVDKPAELSAEVKPSTEKSADG